MPVDQDVEVLLGGFGQPDALQERCLLERVVRPNVDSDYGREHGFDRIRSVRDYRNQVPIVGYADIQPWIARIAAGGRGVLTTEPVRRFFTTSGSTAVLRFRRKRHVKVKVGLPDDGERLALISDAVKTPLRLDANGAWASAEEAVDALRALGSVPIASIEQPLRPDDLAGARFIREETGIPIMADEAVCTLEDAERLIEARAADIFNIRLGKCGGVLGSRRLVERARGSGVGCHLGTLVGETGILTRAAEIFGRFVPGFECLDGKGQNESLLAQDILETPGDAVAAPVSAPGLGVRVSGERIAAHRVER